MAISVMQVARRKQVRDGDNYSMGAGCSPPEFCLPFEFPGGSVGQRNPPRAGNQSSSCILLSIYNVLLKSWSISTEAYTLHYRPERAQIGNAPKTIPSFMA